MQAIIPLAATSEVLFTLFYDRLVRRAQDPPAETFLLGFDSMPIRAETSLWDLAAWTRSDASLAAALQAQPSGSHRRRLPGCRRRPRPTLDPAQWERWRTRFQAHLDTYGHSVYNLDFLNPVAAEEPAPLVNAIRFYLRGQGTNPYERRARASSRRERETTAVLSRLDPWRRAVFRRLLRWAQGIAPIREDALADVGLAWPRMRGLLLELGQRLVGAGIVEQAEDVSWLHRDELERCLAATRGASTANAPAQRPDPVALQEAIEQRKMVWRAQRRATPQLLPRGSWIEALQGLMPAGWKNQTGNDIRGIGASRGRVTATAQVIAGLRDFDRLRPGDILVTSITTPAWTTLFARAAE